MNKPAELQQKPSEQELRQSEERYRVLFEGANDAIFTLRDGSFVDCNKKALEMFQCSPEEFLGRRPEQFSPPLQPDGMESTTKAREKITLALAGNPQFFEWRHRRHDGTLFDAEVSLNRVEYQGKVEVQAIIRDVTEHKRMEDALKESEQRVRLKLESILSPEGEIGNLDLGDIIDARSLQSLVDVFYKLTGMPMGLIDLKGKVLVGVGWQDLCTKFHRINPETCRKCVESDVQLSAGVHHGEYKIYKCKNNMWDVATPVMVGDRQFGNLFIGQFFFENEPLDYELFRSQARQYGFDEKEYIAALEAVPRLSKETLNTSMAFFMKLADILSQLSYSNIKLARSLAERDALMESLRESEERLRFFIEYAPAALAMFDRDMCYLYVSRRWLSDYSLGDRDLRGLSHYEVFPKVPEHWKEAHLRGLTGEVLRAEADRYERADGSVQWVRWEIRPWYDSAGDVGGILIFSEEITERKRAEEELKKSRDELETRVRKRTEELATTVETLLGEITVRERAEESLKRLNRLYSVLSETDQAIVRASERDSMFRDFCRIAVEAGGFLLSWVGLVDEEGGQLKMAAAHGATAYLDDIRISVDKEPAGLGPTGLAVREGTYYICNDFQNDSITRPWHERGRAHGIGASASIALKEEGRVIGALTLYAGEKDFFDRQHEELLLQMGTDISFALDNLKREARRRVAELALQTEIAERLRAVEELREKERLLIQQSRQAAMGEMIGNIAHQWRQPLNTLGLMVQELSLSHELGEFSKEHLDASVRKIMQIIFHMSQTIDDFRNFFRPDKERVQFRVAQVVTKTVSLIEGSFKEQRISIELNAEGDPLIDGYPNEYSQVLLNILLNARDAFLQQKVAKPRVDVRLFTGNGKAVVTVTDNAGGIPEAIMEKIFDPYFTTKAPDKGTGIGLFMSKNIIEKNMHGTLSARNTGAGAEFRIEV